VGFSIANALHNDHSLATGDLIEVKLRLFCVSEKMIGTIPGPSTGSATGRPNWQVSLRSCGYVFRFGRAQRPDRLLGNFKIHQTRFDDSGGRPTSGQKPVKLRMREIEIPRHLLELRARHFFQSGRSPEPGGDGLGPAANRADAN
jgi:hypothetical protein